ncbi:MAG: fatty acid--CoA ligase family protein [Hyphomicrobiaceae bacterium]
MLVDGAGRDGFESCDAYRHGEPIGDIAPGTGASAGDTLVLLYTSGSSNRPKSVPLQHFAVIENGFNIGERQGLGGDDRVLISIPLFWSYGAANALPAALSHGATMVLQSRFEPGGALDLIEKHACTALYTLPAMTNALTAHAGFTKERTQSLRTGVTIGAPQDVRKAAIELGASEICNIYGSTETYGNCCVTPHNWPLEQRATSQGPPLPGVRVRIRNTDTGGLCSTGEIGSIEVTGYLTPGYSGDSAQYNSDVFTDDGWFRTGDLGALDDKGHMHYAGRTSEMIKRSGINVSPAEVEEVLQQHPAVGLAGVTGRNDSDKGEAIVAYIVAVPGSKADAAALLEHCRAQLSGYKVPDVVRFAEALPLTPTGKLMRRELRALAEAEAGSGEAS